MDISKIDKNLKVEGLPENFEAEFYNSTEADKFNIYGLIRENDSYCRMPSFVSKNIEGGLDVLATHTAGGRVCFTTNSKFIAISAFLIHVTKSSHMPLTGSCGFDMYVDDVYCKTFIPPFDFTDSYSSLAEFPDEKEKNITINFPLYSGVKDLYIGLQKGATVKPFNPHINDKKVVYYGSSITQGGCASRPGLCYQAHIARKTKTDFLNLGFSGSAKAEPEVCDYIASLKMDVFVYDYDHNAPDLEHLEKTHEQFFKAIREKHPTLPIIIISKPDIDLSSFWKLYFQKRRDVIYKTYSNAINSGDENVYFIDGSSFFNGEDDRFSCTVDGCHPNDLGFNKMATIIGEYVQKALK